MRTHCKHNHELTEDNVYRYKHSNEKQCRKCRHQYDFKRRVKDKTNGIKKANPNPYKQTPKGYLSTVYSRMRSRVSGEAKSKAHLYKGKELISREEFYVWALSCNKYFEMFEAYKKSEFRIILAPSIDRVDTTLGYTIDNMRWLTHSENSRLGAISQQLQLKTKSLEPSPHTM